MNTTEQKVTRPLSDAVKRLIDRADAIEAASVRQQLRESRKLSRGYHWSECLRDLLHVV